MNNSTLIQNNTMEKQLNQISQHNEIMTRINCSQPTDCWSWRVNTEPSHRQASDKLQSSRAGSLRPGLSRPNDCTNEDTIAINYLGGL